MFEQYNLHELLENELFFNGMVFFAIVIILVNIANALVQFSCCLIEYFERNKIRKQFRKICEGYYYHIEENISNSNVPSYLICDKDNIIFCHISDEDNARTVCAVLNDDLAGRKFNVNVCKGRFNIYKYLKSHKDGQEVKR